MTQLYNYNESGEYTVTTVAKVDPLDGSTRIPALAVLNPVPSLLDNECAVWNGTDWVITPDFRGTDYWTSHTNKVTITKINVTVPDGSSLTQPNKTAEELSTEARLKRDMLLGISDSMALADRITDEWKTYRQALRDLPAQSGFPDVAFPTPPSGA